MYINAFKANRYSYVDKNFPSIEETMEYLKADTLDFKAIKGRPTLTAKHGNWTVVVCTGEMPQEEGYVDMREESGAFDDIF